MKLLELGKKKTRPRKTRVCVAEGGKKRRKLHGARREILVWTPRGRTREVRSPERGGGGRRRPHPNRGRIAPPAAAALARC